MLNGGLSQLTKNYLLQTCAYCKKEMKLVEGDIICGNKWYHKDCFSFIQNQDSMDEATREES